MALDYNGKEGCHFYRTPPVAALIDPVAGREPLLRSLSNIVWAPIKDGLTEFHSFG
jgi:phosphoribosylformylglycinamidine synthase